MSDEYITRNEHEEFCRRLDSENERQNHRIENLERATQEISSIANSVERLATNMENMCKEQEKQGERLKQLENRDGEKWRQIVGYITTTIIGLVLGYIFTAIL